MVDDYIDLYQELIGGASPLGTARISPAGERNHGAPQLVGAAWVTRHAIEMSTFTTIADEELIAIPSPFQEPRLALQGT